jgi:hypothetical protein
MENQWQKISLDCPFKGFFQTEVVLCDFSIKKYEHTLTLEFDVRLCIPGS